MGRSKIEFGGEVLIDLTNDTTTAETTLAGYTGHGADGEPFVGTMAAGANITSGADVPSADMGSDGDYYIKEESEEEVTSETVIQDENTLLLLHGDSLTDSSIYNVPITNNGVTVSTAQSKFGGSSLYFNGQSTLIINKNDVLPENSDFTIEWWEYRTQLSGEDVVFNIPSNVNNFYGLLAGYYDAGKANYYLSSDGNTWALNSISMGIPELNKWNHFALVRKDSEIISFKNGEIQSTNTLSGNISLGENPIIGSWIFRTENEAKYVGYLDEFRISNVARWTDNFTVPINPYQAKSTIISTANLTNVGKIYLKRNNTWEEIMAGSTGGRFVYNSRLSDIWQENSGIFTQTIELENIQAIDTPHITPVYGEDIASESQAWSFISKATTSNGTITFYCYGNKPQVGLNIQIEVIK